MKYSQMKRFLMEHKDSMKPPYISTLDGILTAGGELIGYQELEMDSPYLDVHEDTSYTKDYVTLHSHEFYELLFCRSGNLQYLIGNTRYQIRKNDIILVPPGTSHRPLFLEQLREPYQRTVLWINNDFFETCKQNFFADAGSSQYAPQKQLPYVIRPEGTLLNQIDQLLAALLYEGSTMRLGSELYRMGLFLQLFCLFYRMNDHPQSDIPKPENTGLLDQILNYIELHLSEDLSLASISAQFMVSQSAGVAMHFASKGVTAIKSKLTWNKSGTTTLQTGGRQIDYNAYIKRLETIDMEYENIRIDTTDISKIAQNTGMPEWKISRIKDHVFSNEHILDAGVKRFDADSEIADAWYRLTNGTYNQNDIDLLNHEYFESKFESFYKTDYRTAHNKTEESGRIWDPYKENN